MHDNRTERGFRAEDERTPPQTSRPTALHGTTHHTTTPEETIHPTQRNAPRETATVDVDGSPIATNFARPCLHCGTTIHIVDTVEQPHDCEPIHDQAALIAHAWWAGHDHAAALRPVVPSGAGSAGDEVSWKLAELERTEGDLAVAIREATTAGRALAAAGVTWCRECGCTDNDCSRCIERTGSPCAWVDPWHAGSSNLCTACLPENR